MSIEVEVKCKDYGRPGCLGNPDDRFTMDFEDIGEGKIYFCASCGPQNRAVSEALEKWLSEAKEEDLKKLEALIIQAEKERSKQCPSVLWRPLFYPNPKF